MVIIGKFLLRALRLLSARKPSDMFAPGARAGQAGNVSIIVAVAAVPILAAVGGGIDYSRVLTERAHLQDAVDSAAIAAALDATGVLSNQQTAANRAFIANTKGTNLENYGADGDLTTETSNNVNVMKYTGTAVVPAYLLKLVGVESIPISAVAKAGVTINTAEIVFVLDNTGSMAQNNKMSTLKTSLDAVLATLVDPVTGNNLGTTKVALVPFDTQVALSDANGMTGYAGNFASVSQSYTCSGLTGGQCDAVTTNAKNLCNWVTNTYSNSAGTACATNASTYTKYNNGYYYVYTSTWFNNPYYNSNCYYYCSNNTRYLTYYRVAAFSANNSSASQQGNSTTNGYYWSYSSGVTPSYVGYNNYNQYGGNITYGYPYTGGYGATGSTIKDNNTITTNDDLMGVGTANWSGCVIDRTQPYDAQSDAPVSSNAATLYPAAKCATNSLLPIVPLTTDIASVRAYAKKMTPAGNTNVTIGIQWGMEVLSPSAPFQGGAAFTDPTVNKYMVVLTDGLNTQNRWTTTASAIDARMSEACTNAKKLNITIFTIRLEQGNSEKLQACASNTGYYYNLSNASELSGTLGKIMKSIRKIRLTN